MFKKLLFIIALIALGLGIWVGFALWTGIYAIYSYPPGKDYPDGATLLITRAEGEPRFNSPNYVPPPEEPDPQRSSISFARPKKSKKSPLSRIIVELPYIEWAYKKSLDTVLKGK